jgi:hypothetical protein
VLYVAILSDPIPVGDSYEQFAASHAESETVSGTGVGFGLCQTESDLESLTSLVSETAWNAPDKASLTAAKAAVAGLCRVTLKIDGSVELARAASGKAKAAVKIDELDSYESLVREAGTLNYHRLLNSVMQCNAVRCSTMRCDEERIRVME